MLTFAGGLFLKKSLKNSGYLYQEIICNDGR
jgi:hypothetical protein